MTVPLPPLELKAFELRQGPGVEADWPCVFLSVKTALDCLEAPAPERLRTAILTALGNRGVTLPDDCTIAVALAHLLLGLQRAIVPVPERFTIRAMPGGFDLAVACLDPTVGAAATRMAVRCCNLSLLSVADGSAAAEMRRFAQSLAALNLGAEMRVLLDEAARRNIPWVRLTSNILQLGQGKMQRRLHLSLSEKTSAIAIAIAKDRVAAARILGEAGIPALRREVAKDAAHAAQLARDMGLPVTIKSADGSAAGEIRTDSDAATVQRLFTAAERKGRVVIEQQMPGVDHAMLVVEGRLVATSIDRSASGGARQDVTRDVHPENRDAAERAARTLGLDIAEAHFVSRDISRSYLETGGAIREVFADPKWHAGLDAESARSVAQRVLEEFVPSPQSGRIPTALITGTNGKTTTSRMVAAILQQAGHVVGLTTTDGAQIGSVRIAAGDLAGPKGARMLLGDPTVTAAVIESARGAIIKHGLSVDECTVGAVTNLGTDHVGLDGIADVGEMARLKARVLRAARGTCVLNADDAVCMSLRDEARGKRLILVSREPDNPVIAEHVGDGGVAVVSRRDEQGEMLILVEAESETPVIDAAQIPATYNGAAEFNIANAMFASAISFGLGVPVETIALGLRGFRPDTVMSRGRANLITGWSYDVLVDYAANIDGLTALGKFVSRLPVKGKRRVILVAGGNRQDWVYGEVAAAAAPWFDSFVCSVDPPRGRKDGEVGGLLAKGLMAAGVAADRIAISEPFTAAVDHILTMAEPDDLVVIIPYDASRVIAKLFANGGRDATPAVLSKM
jgi:UDP-N-acetylmuramyl tripeptide synthase